MAAAYNFSSRLVLLDLLSLELWRLRMDLVLAYKIILRFPRIFQHLAQIVLREVMIASTDEV